MTTIIAILLILFYLSHKYAPDPPRSKTTRSKAKQYKVHTAKPTQAQLEKDRREKARRVEQERKQREQAEKRIEARQAARAEMEQINVLIDRYMNIIDQYEMELEQDTTPEKRQLQIMEKLTTLETKIQKLEQRKAKCYYIAKH